MRTLKKQGLHIEIDGDYFYSLMNCWQREVGYCRLYDEAAPLFNMIMDCEPVTFSYEGKTVADRTLEGAVRHHHRRRNWRIQYRT